MKPKHRSWISNETLAFKLKCTVSVNYTWNFKDLLQKKKNAQYLINKYNFYIVTY